MVRVPAQVLPALEFIRDSLTKRLDLFESVKAKKLSDYNRQHPDSKLPRIIVFIDEMATLLGLGDLTGAIHNELRVISSQGRAVGIHLVICTQHSSVDVLPGWIKTNMTLRISGKMPSHQASMVILDSVSAAALPNIPGRMIVSEGRFETVVQSPLITDDEIAIAVRMAREHPVPPREMPELAPAPTGFNREDIIRIALEVYDGKLSPRRIHDQIEHKQPLHKIRKLVDQIVAEKEIEYQGQKYRVKPMGNSHVLLPIETEPEHSSGSAEEHDQADRFFVDQKVEGSSPSTHPERQSS
jgi:DNA segregation ATPase FtsK/SpoIIIE-like protein